MENESDETVFFSDILGKMNELNIHLSKINSTLKHNKLEEIAYDRGNGSLENYFKSDPNNLTPFKPIELFIQQSLKIKNEVEKYVKEYNYSWEIKQKKAADVRKSERNAMWVLWFQKLIRWVLGAAAAVLLYSSVVWASEHCPFIKIPIKDWFIHE